MTRLLDVVFSLLGLVFLFPLIFLILILGWVETRSPIFCQQRVGHKKRPFTLVKFRTMHRETALDSRLKCTSIAGWCT